MASFMKHYLNKRIITIKIKIHIRDKDMLRLIIDDYIEKRKIYWNGS